MFNIKQKVEGGGGSIGSSDFVTTLAVPSVADT